MTLFLPSDNIIVERIANGDDRLLGMLYDKWRSEFENVLRPNCSSSLSGEIDFDELYQESVLVLYNYIISGKIFTQGDKIYCVNKYDEICYNAWLIYSNFVRMVFKERHSPYDFKKRRF